MDYSFKNFLAKAVNITLLALTVMNLFSAWTDRATESHCIARDISWSPIPETIRKRAWTFFPQATLFTESKFMALSSSPSELEEQWNSFLPDHPIAIPSKQLRKLGISPSSSYAHPPRITDKALAIPEVFVQLGCLNLLRQILEPDRRNGTELDYDYSRLAAFSGPAETVLRRADLCVERLRDAIMCWTDLSTILQDVKRSTDGDEKGELFISGLRFDSRHKCRDLGAVKEWTERNAVKAVRMDNLWWGGRVFA